MRSLSYAAVAVPLATLVADPGGWFPFGPAKWAAVAVATAVLAGTLARRRRMRWPRLAGALWLVLLATLTLATLGAVVDGERWYPIVGTPERHLGLLTWGLLAVAALAGAQLGRRERRLLAGATVVTLAIVGLYGSLEWWWRAPIALASDSERVGGPFGSAAYLGAALCLLLPIAVGVAADRSWPRWSRAGAAIAAGLGAVALIGSGTRAAWLALAVTIVVAAVLAATARRPRVAVRIVVTAAALAAVGAIATAGRADDVLARTAGATSRVDEWRLAVRVIADHPILGVGPEGYRTAVGAAVDERYERRYGREIVPDRAHSGPLDVAVTGGIVAGLADVGLLVVVAVAGGRALRRGPPTLAGLGAGALAYFGQQLLLFPVAELDPVAWLVAGSVIGATSTTTVVVVRRPVVRHLATAIAVVIGAAMVVGGVLDVAADRLAADAVAAADAETGAAAAQRAVDRRPDVVRYQLLLAAATTATGTLAGTDRAIAATETALRWSPGDPIARRRHADALTRRAAITGTDRDADAAVRAWAAVVDDDPNCFPCQLGRGDAASLAGDAVGAEVAWSTADRLTDHDPEAAQRLRRLFVALERPADVARIDARLDELASS